MTQPIPSNDLRGLIAGILSETRALLRAEVQLARRELSDSAARAGSGLLLFGLAALVALVGLCALAVAAVLGVAATGIALHWAALLVAIASLVIALLFAWIGRARLSSAALTPRRTVNQVKSDIKAVKEMARA